MKNRVRIAALSKQRGALTVTTPLIVLLIFFLTVLMLDGARLYAVKREMQSIANAAAVAAAGSAKACGGPNVHEDSIFDVAVSAALDQGMGKIGGSLTDVAAGTLVLSPSINPEFEGPDILGFLPVSKIVEESNAVRVVYESDQPISVFFPKKLSTVKMRAVAVAQHEVVATVSAAGSTVAVGGHGQAGLLGNILGGILTGDNSFSLNITDLESLQETTFLLGDFLTTLRITDLLEVADTVVGAEELVQAIAVSIAEAGSPAGTFVSSLLHNLNVVDTKIDLGEVIAILGDVPSPEKVKVPVYDTLLSVALNLLKGAVFSADTAPLQIDLRGLPGVSGLLQLDVSVHLAVDGAPTIAIGTAQYSPDGEPLLQFQASDILLALTARVEIPGIAAIELPLLVETGGGHGFLEYARCASGGQNKVGLGLRVFPRVAVISTSELSSTGQPSLTAASITVLEALEDILTVRLTAEIEDLEVGGTRQEGEEIYEEIDLHLREPVYAGVPSDLSLSSVKDALDLDITVELEEEGCKWWNLLICEVLAPILNPLAKFIVGEVANETVEVLLRAVVNEILDVLLIALVEPLLDILGINLGGMALQITDASQVSTVLMDCSKLNCDVIVPEAP